MAKCTPDLTIIMDQTTQIPEVQRESVADLALKTWTMYFLICAIILGILLYIAIWKTMKICCWNCMHGSNLTKDIKEDPRVPQTIFRAPSILAKLQDHYDNVKSSAGSSRKTNYKASSTDIELGNVSGSSAELLAETQTKTRTLSYLHAMQDDIGRLQEDGSTEEQNDTVVQIEPSDYSEANETLVNRDNNNEDDMIRKYNVVSKFGSLMPSEAGTSPQGDLCTVTDICESQSEYDGLATTSRSTLSRGSLLSTTSDKAPLVSMNPTTESSQRGRYKKYARPSDTPPTNVSTRTASAKSSRRASKSYDKF